MLCSYQLPRQLFDSIDPRWYEDIVRFVDSGDASEEFLAFLDRNRECQNIVETAFTLVSQDVAATARQLRESGAAERLEHGESINVTFARLFTHMLLALLALDPQEREQILAVVSGWLLPQQQHAFFNDVAEKIGAPRQILLSIEEEHAT
jgi:hypothetical protein